MLQMTLLSTTIHPGVFGGFATKNGAPIYQSTRRRTQYARAIIHFQHPLRDCAVVKEKNSKKKPLLKKLIDGERE